MLNLNKESVLLIEKEEKKLSSIFDKINELEMINSSIKVVKKIYLLAFLDNEI